MSTRPCPVCGATSVNVLYHQAFAAFSAGSIGDGYDVVACESCGACYASGLPAAERFAHYYADSSKYDLGGQGAELPPRDSERFADQAGFVQASLSDRAFPVLDVG